MAESKLRRGQPLLEGLPTSAREIIDALKDQRLNPRLRELLTWVAEWQVRNRGKTHAVLLQDAGLPTNMIGQWRGQNFVLQADAEALLDAMAPSLGLTLAEREAYLALVPVSAKSAREGSPQAKPSQAKYLPYDTRGSHGEAVLKQRKPKQPMWMVSDFDPEGKASEVVGRFRELMRLAVAQASIQVGNALDTFPVDRDYFWPKVIEGEAIPTVEQLEKLLAYSGYSPVHKKSRIDLPPRIGSSSLPTPNQQPSFSEGLAQDLIEALTLPNPPTLRQLVEKAYNDVIEALRIPRDRQPPEPEAPVRAR